MSGSNVSGTTAPVAVTDTPTARQRAADLACLVLAPISPGCLATVIATHTVQAAGEAKQQLGDAVEAIPTGDVGGGFLHDIGDVYGDAVTQTGDAAARPLHEVSTIAIATAVAIGFIAFIVLILFIAYVAHKVG